MTTVVYDNLTTVVLVYVTEFFNKPVIYMVDIVDVNRNAGNALSMLTLKECVSLTNCIYNSDFLCSPVTIRHFPVMEMFYVTLEYLFTIFLEVNQVHNRILMDGRRVQFYGCNNLGICSKIFVKFFLHLRDFIVGIKSVISVLRQLSDYQRLPVMSPLDEGIWMLVVSLKKMIMELLTSADVGTNCSHLWATLSMMSGASIPSEHWREVSPLTSMKRDLEKHLLLGRTRISDVDNHQSPFSSLFTDSADIWIQDRRIEQLTGNISCICCASITCKVRVLCYDTSGSSVNSLIHFQNSSYLKHSINLLLGAPESITGLVFSQFFLLHNVIKPMTSLIHESRRRLETGTQLMNIQLEGRLTFQRGDSIIELIRALNLSGDGRQLPSQIDRQKLNYILTFLTLAYSTTHCVLMLGDQLRLVRCYCATYDRKIMVILHLSAITHQQDTGTQKIQRNLFHIVNPLACAVIYILIGRETFPKHLC